MSDLRFNNRSDFLEEVRKCKQRLCTTYIHYMETALGIVVGRHFDSEKGGREEEQAKGGAAKEHNK